MQRLRDLGFSVTKRTVERDLVELSGLFGIRCNDVSVPYRWRWMEGRTFDLPGLDFSEALSLTMVEDLLGKLLPASLLRGLRPKFEQARARLSDKRTNRYARWKEWLRYVPSSLPFLPPKIESNVLDTVQEAIVQERQLWVRYLGLDRARASELTLHPLALIQGGPITYLVAVASGYTDPRLYAVHRMTAVRITEERSLSGNGFSLDEFLKKGGMQFGEGTTIRLRAKVSNKLACYLAESPLKSDQELMPKGKEWHILTVTLKDSWQLQFWILSQGPGITVLQPKALRERVRSSLQAALHGYRAS